MRYNEKIAANVAVYFTHREGGLLNIMKLIKLMYLAERESLRLYGEPITGDMLVSMPYGPVMSNTLDHINGAIPSVVNGWDSWLTDKENRNVGLVNNNLTENLIELSEADIVILDSVYNQFGGMTPFELSDYTHDNCGEWEDPQGSSTLIPLDRLLKNVGYAPDMALEISHDIHEQAKLDDLLSDSSLLSMAS